MLYWFRYTTKHAFDGLISRWDTAEETISKREDVGTPGWLSWLSDSLWLRS